MKKILAPVDFSPVSMNAVMYAANLAAYLDMHLVLFHVVEVPVHFSQTPVTITNEPNIHEESTSRLKKLAAELETLLKGQVSIETISRIGGPQYELVNYCQQTHPYMVIMSTKNNGPLDRFLFGSTTLAAMHRCESPVMVIPAGFAFCIPKKAGLATDLKSVYQSVPGEKIKTLVSDMGVHLEIVHVNNNYEDEALVMEEVQSIKTIFVEQQPRVKLLNNTFVEESLLQYAVSKKFDFLIVIPKKHNWMDQLLNHQYSNNLALNTPIPILVIKAT